jgi:hypothetical protein
VSESDTENQKGDIIWAKIGATTPKMKQAWEKGGTSGKKGEHLKGKGTHLEVKHETEKQGGNIGK